MPPSASPVTASSLTACVVLLGIAAGASGCASVAPPFDKMKDSAMTVYRLQNFEPPAQAQAPAATTWQIPTPIQQWIQAGASLLPPGLLPPGLVPGTAPAATAVAPDAPRFHGFRVLDYQPVNDAATKSDIVSIFGAKTDFQSPASSCMFAEFGFAIAQPDSPTPADILVSLSCGQVQSYNFTWPFAQAGLTPDAARKIAAIAQRVFQGR